MITSRNKKKKEVERKWKEIRKYGEGERGRK